MATNWTVSFVCSCLKLPLSFSCENHRRMCSAYHAMAIISFLQKVLTAHLFTVLVFSAYCKESVLLSCLSFW